MIAVAARHLFVTTSSNKSVLLTAVPAHSHARICHAATKALLHHPLLKKALREHEKHLHCCSTMAVRGRTSPKKHKRNENGGEDDGSPVSSSASGTTSPIITVSSAEVDDLPGVVVATTTSSSDTDHVEYIHC